MKWYEKPWATILFLIVFPPVGLFLMFKYQKWGKPAKITCTVLACLLFIYYIAVGSNNNDQEYISATTSNISSAISSVPVVSETTTSSSVSESQILSATSDESSASEESSSLPESSIISSTTSSSSPEISSESSTSQVSSTASTVSSKSTSSQNSSGSSVQESSVILPTSSIQNEIVLISITNPVSRNENATVTVKGKPNTDYNISVYYSSKSSADGLESKKSDSDGYVSWTWKVGGRTNPGNYYLKINGGGASLKVDFTVQ